LRTRIRGFVLPAIPFAGTAFGYGAGPGGRLAYGCCDQEHRAIWHEGEIPVRN